MSVRLEGIGLHGGRACALRLSRVPGPTSLGRGVDRAKLSDLFVEGRDRTTIARLPSGAELRGVEHLLSAVCGVGAFDGIALDVEGDEVPLFDGAAAELFDAIAAECGDACCNRRARVVRAGSFEEHGTVVHLAQADAVDVTVEVDFDAARFGVALRGEASWQGDANDYRARIAPARTFGAARELEALRARALAMHVPEGVVVALDLSDPARAPRDAEEPIRHKLLDALGDLAPLGAPMCGRVRIVRPSHRGTRAAIDRARREGAIVLVG